LGASRFRIRHYFIRIRIMPSTSKKINKNLDFYYFVISFRLFFLISFLHLCPKFLGKKILSTTVPIRCFDNSEQNDIFMHTEKNVFFAPLPGIRVAGVCCRHTAHGVDGLLLAVLVRVWGVRGWSPLPGTGIHGKSPLPGTGVRGRPPLPGTTPLVKKSTVKSVSTSAWKNRTKLFHLFHDGTVIKAR
jgi:hypothetical protein